MEYALYRTLFEHAPVGILVADAQSYYLDANPGMCQMLGYAHDELVGLHASDIVTQTEVSHIGPALDDIQSSHHYLREWEFKRKDGSTFVAEVNATMLPDGRLLGMVRDITERRQSQLLSTRLAAIVEDSDDAIVSQDLNGIIVSWNRGAEKIFGYHAIGMIGTSVLRLVPPELQEQELQIMRKNLRGEKVPPYESVRLTRERQLIEVSVAASPIRDASGRLVGISKVVRDITALKTHERALIRMTRLYDALSQVNQAIVWSKTREELFERVCRVLLENGRFRMAWIGWRDPATEQIVPLAVAGDVSGYIKSIKIYADDRPEGRGPSGTAFRSGEPYICNHLLTDPNTLPWRPEIERRGFRASAVFPITEQGTVRGVMNVYSDEENFFRSEEIALLQEAAGDISFALDNLMREELRVQAEMQAQSEKNFSDTMIESMPGILYFYNEEGKFLRWNHNFELVSGYSGTEIEHMHPLDFFSTAEKEILQHRIGEVFATGESFVEASFVAKDGSSRPYFFTGRRIEFQGMPCLVGMGIDISDRKTAELQLRAMQGRLEAVVEHLREGLVIADPDGDMLRWNPESLRLLGFGDLEEGRRRQREFGKIFEIFTLDGARLAPEQWPLARVRRGEAIDDFQAVVRRLDFEWEKIFSFTGRSVEYAPGAQLAFLTLQDITERKRAERSLLDSKDELEKLVVARTADLQSALIRAEAADQIKSAFLATMSHELRTPLNSIIGFTGILLQSLAGPLNPEQAKQLGMVQGSARHLLELINDVLDISKIEAGQLQIRAAPFDLRDSVERMAASLRPMAERKAIAFEVFIASSIGEISSDQRRIEQIMLNLLNNAIKFTEQGSVTLRVEPQDDFYPAGGGGPLRAVRFQVTDTGIGIKPNDLSLLFQPFRQIDSGLTRQYEGTGLGLVICQRLVRLLQGEINVSSILGQGSTFSVTIPSRLRVSS